MRALLAIPALLLAGCGPGLEFNSSPYMTTGEMRARATHAFIGTIESHHLESWTFFKLPDHSGYWRILRRRVLVEQPGR